jgi:hypothetical protein
MPGVPNNHLPGRGITDLTSRARYMDDLGNFRRNRRESGDLEERVTAIEAEEPETGGGSGDPVEVLDEGVSLTTAVASLDFVGVGVTATVIGDAVTVTIPGGLTGPAGADGADGADGAPGADGLSVESLDEGVSLTATTASLDFVGAGVTATAVGNDVTVTIPGATPAPIEVLDEGVSKTTDVESFNFVGAGVVVTNTGDDVTVTIAGGGGGGGDVEVLNDGVSLTAAVESINFVGENLLATAAGNDVTVRVKREVTTTSTDISLDETHDIIICNPSAGSIFVELPPVADIYEGWTCRVVNYGSNFSEVEIFPAGAELILYDTAQEDDSQYILLDNGHSCDVTWDGTNWYVHANYNGQIMGGYNDRIPAFLDEKLQGLDVLECAPYDGGFGFWMASVGHNTSGAPGGARVTYLGTGDAVWKTDGIAVEIISAADTLTYVDGTFLVDCGGGDVLVSHSATNSDDGRRWCVKKVDSGPNVVTFSFEDYDHNFGGQEIEPLRFHGDSVIIEMGPGGLHVIGEKRQSLMPWQPLIVVPPATGWSWLNQGCATLNSTREYQNIESASDGIATLLGMSCRVRAMPGTPTVPFSVTMAFKFMNPNASLASFGFLIRDPSGSPGCKFFGWACYGATDWRVITQNYNVGITALVGGATTLWSPGYPASGGMGSLFWLRYRDDATNRYLDVSADGIIWEELLSEGRGTDFTATEIGIAMKPSTAASGQMNKSALTLVHWREVG